MVGQIQVRAAAAGAGEGPAADRRPHGRDGLSCAHGQHRRSGWKSASVSFVVRACACACVRVRVCE